MAQKTPTEFTELLAEKLSDNTQRNIKPSTHHVPVLEALRDSVLWLNSSNLQGGGTIAIGQFPKWDGSKFVGDTPSGFPSATVSKTDATGVALANANAGTHYEVTGDNAPTFTTATGLTAPAMWQITNSNADLSTVVTIAEGSGCSSNFGGDLKIKPGQTVTIIHQGSDRFVYQLSDDWETVVMGFIVRNDGSNNWSILSDTDHKPIYEAGITASASIVAGSPNELKISFSTTDSSRKIVSGMLANDEITKGVAMGHKINQTSTSIDFQVSFGGLRMREVNGYFTWGGSSWTWAQGEGDVNLVLTTNTASQIVATHTGEYAGLHVPKISNSATDYWVKHITSINSANMNMLITDTDGNNITPTTGDRIFVTRRLYGIAFNSDFDADDLSGVTATTNFWGMIIIQRSKY